MRKIKVKQNKKSNKFYKDVFGKSRGTLRITSAGNKQGVILAPVKLSKGMYRDDYINHENLNNDNRRVTINTFIDDTEFSERNLNDIVVLVVRTTLPDYKVFSNDYNFAEVYTQELQATLQQAEAEELTPTHIIVSDYIYGFYVFEKNVHVGHCTGVKKRKVISFSNHITENICERLNAITQDNFEPVPLTASINLPFSPYAVFKWKKDNNTNSGYADVISRGMTGLATPEKGRIWKSLDELADAASMPRYSSYRKGTKKTVKHHVKDREFFGLPAMHERRMNLVMNVLSSRKRDRNIRMTREEHENFTFLYFNFAFSLTKNKSEAINMTIKAFPYIFNEFEEGFAQKIKRICYMPESYVAEGRGYMYSDETLFRELGITKEEAAEKYGYVTSDKKEYDKAYSKARRDAIREEKETNSEAFWQKMSVLRKKMAQLRIDGMSFRRIAEELKMSVSTVAYHFKEHKNIMDNYLQNGIPSCCPI